jgi:hypothetical protein
LRRLTHVTHSTDPLLFVPIEKRRNAVAAFRANRKPAPIKANSFTAIQYEKNAMNTALKILGLTGMLYLSNAHSEVVVAPDVVAPGIVAAPPPPPVVIDPPPAVVIAPPPPPAVLVPPSVAYVAPLGVAPGPGYAWRYQARVGWGWWHPRWGWHRTVVVHHWRRW